MKNIESLNKTIEALTKENDQLKKEIQKLTSDRNSVHISQEEQNYYKESEDRFRTIFETSKLGNKVISSDLKILQVNPAMVALLGYDNKDDIIGTRIVDYAPEEFHEHWKLLQKKLWKTNMPSFTLETCLKKKDGSTIWCNVTSILFEDQKETFGYTIIEDVSEQKMLRLKKEQSGIFEVTLNTQEEERRRISESFHNGLGQLLYGTKLSMDYLTVKLAVENPNQFQTSKDYAAKLLTDSINDVRRISHELMPSILVDFGLKAAIKDICDQLQSGIRFDCQVSLGDVKLDNFVELAVFRTAQELMLNVVKHAKATYAKVEVKLAGSDVIITVKDKGQGMEATMHNKPGIGLSSIRNKVDLLKGSLTIESVPGEGTLIIVRLPHQI